MMHFKYYLNDDNKSLWFYNALTTPYKLIWHFMDIINYIEEQGVFNIQMYLGVYQKVN